MLSGGLPQEESTPSFIPGREGGIHYIPFIRFAPLSYLGPHHHLGAKRPTVDLQSVPRSNVDLSQVELEIPKAVTKGKNVRCLTSWEVPVDTFSGTLVTLLLCFTTIAKVKLAFDPSNKNCVDEMKNSFHNCVNILGGIMLASFVKIGLVCVALICSAPAMAEDSAFPVRPVRLVVPYAAGQGTDVAARVIAEKLSNLLGQPIVIENRAGAGGNIGAASILQAPADGYTLLMGTNATHVVNQFLYPNIGYDPETDFTPVALVGLFPMSVLVQDASPFKTVSDIASAATKAPDKLNAGLPSTTSQIVLELFRREAKAPTFGITYKSSASMVTDLLGGRLDMAVDTVAAARPLLGAGKLRAIAVTTLRSTPVLPGTQSVAEQGVNGFEITPWNAIFVRKGAPQDRVQRISADIKRVLDMPEVRSKLLGMGIEPVYLDSVATSEFMRKEKEKWGRIIKDNKITAN